MASEKVNLQKSYSALNESIVKLFDEAGVRRSMTVPYVEGQDMQDHVAAVGQAATESGGLTQNLLLSMHHADGKGWGSGDGHTVGYVADKLRTTLISKKDKNAVDAIKVAQTHINNLASLLGKDNPVIQTSQGQLNLVKQTDGEGMNLLDFGVLLTQIMYRPTQLAAKMHSGTKPGGHAVHLRAPAAQAAAPDDQQGEEQGEGQDQDQDEGAQPDASQQASAAPQAAPQAAAPQAAAPAPAGAQG